MSYRIGIDAGSKTIKVVVVGDDGEIVHSLYRRHRSDIKTTLLEVLHDMAWRYGNLEGTVGITGSAGIGIAETLELPFVQEVVATTHAVRARYPQADAVIELGGEDAKIIYLTGGIEQRMNSTCAGGTGGFIDTIAFMLGVSSKEMSRLALGASHVYPISSRCAVFAQTDVRPLLNAGARPADIAASALDAVVRQTIGGLACGRPIKGKVVFLGGPLEHIPNLVQRFRTALNLSHRAGIKPANAHLFTAAGAAIKAAEKPDAHVVSLEHLHQSLMRTHVLQDDSLRLPPLFANEEELSCFRARHGTELVDRVRLFDCSGPMYLGIDAGSTAVKIALLDSHGRLAYSDYHLTDGDPLKTAADMLDSMYVSLSINTYIAHATVTGYGEELIMAGLGVDSGVVETLAHVRAAQRLCPDLTFLLDIGGQDIKAIWVRDGHIADAVLNEACSSGCGSFIEGTAHSLKTTPYRFSDAALQSKAPVDLGTKCTVFMTSRVRHAQKMGVPLEDIAAGVALSVVKNALYRVVEVDKFDELGQHIVVQGGAFKSDAVLRAFELVSGKEAVRPDAAHLMGAIGSALIARDRSSHDGNLEARSGLVDRETLALMHPVRKMLRCSQCGNACPISIVEFGQGRSYVSGGRCDKALVLAESSQVVYSGTESMERPPNAIAVEQRLLANYTRKEGNSQRGAVLIGILPSLVAYDQVPFWHTFFSELGFSVALPDCVLMGSGRSAYEGMDTIPSESACYPAKLTHIKVHALLDQEATAVFLPHYVRAGRCPVASEYANALADSIPDLRDKKCRLLAPALTQVAVGSMCASDDDLHVLMTCINQFARDSLLPEVSNAEFAHALEEASKKQLAFVAAIEKENEKALAWARDLGRKGVVLAGRPYHADPLVLHGIDSVLQDLGFSVVNPLGVPGEGQDKANEDKQKRDEYLLCLADYVVQNPSLELIYLRSFGCGYDAASLQAVRRELQNAGKPFTAFKIDDIVDTAHIRIRLRTLAEELESGVRRPSVCPRPVSDPGARISSAPVLSVIDRIERADIDTARANVASDICYVASAIAGRVIRLMHENPSIDGFIIPYVCDSCLLDDLPNLVEHALGKRPLVQWEGTWDANHCSKDEGNNDCQKPGEEPRARLRIGIVGCPLLCFEPAMNERLVDIVSNMGCEVVMPYPELLAIDNVRYLDQLDSFAAQGVNHVLYLQSFGCLKGHVQARGALHEFAKRYPGMPITVLDYDPETSSLNRENRIRLVIESLQDNVCA